ncbi:MAG: DUF5060 domain-containing protein, partial [Spirochaetaceae bacterium]|nr:DUF5060 domain-containing protein [Spirochaetaceae bacterium]
MPRHFTVGDEYTPRFGTHEVCLEAHSGFSNPYRDVDLEVTFSRPDGCAVSVKGFYDGGNDFKARAYCDAVGSWSWSASSNHPDLANQHGVFEVIPSSLKGKLRVHPQDTRQFAFDNGEWFLHIGDTAYRYVCDAEPNWREYIEQAAAAGMTKIRTWFCRGRSDVQALFQTDRTRLNLSYWREIDRRVRYALDHFPDIILQLIPFGEDAEEVYRYSQADGGSAYLARYAQARFSSFANVTWCISNDLRITTGIESGLFPSGWEEEKKEELVASIDKIGRDMANREPWSTLITNHQHRFSGYSFVKSPWSDIVTLEDLGQVTGELVLKYRALSNAPVVLDEDRF